MLLLFDTKVTGLFSVATLNVLWRMIAGFRYKLDDPEHLILLEKLRRAFRTGDPSGGLVNMFPILKTIAPRLSGYAESMAIISDMQNFFRVSTVNFNFILKF
jgi:hypothetical protein